MIDTWRNTAQECSSLVADLNGKVVLRMLRSYPNPLAPRYLDSY